LKQLLDIRRMSILAIYLATMLVAKFTFGFVLGFEIITSMFVFAAMIFELPLLIVLVICFNLLVLSMGGIGAWWVVYWPLWLSLVITTYFMKSILSKNVIYYSLWTMLWAFSLWIWFFFSDWALLGFSGAQAMVVTGIITNTIGATTNLGVSAILFWAIPSFIKMYNSNTINRY